MSGSASHMSIVVAVGGVLLLATAARGLAPFDLAGTTHVGERSEPNAVVWLESAGPRGATREKSCSINGT